MVRDTLQHLVSFMSGRRWTGPHSMGHVYNLCFIFIHKIEKWKSFNTYMHIVDLGCFIDKSPPQKATNVPLHHQSIAAHLVSRENGKCCNFSHSLFPITYSIMTLYKWFLINILKRLREDTIVMFCRTRKTGIFTSLSSMPLGTHYTFNKDNCNLLQ